MTTPNYYVLFKPDEDGTPKPTALRASNVRVPGQWPRQMPLPRWEPTWVIGEAIDNVLDVGQADPKHPSWENEPVARNLDHIIDHVLSFQAQYLSHPYEIGDAEITDLLHAATRLAMVYATYQQWLRDGVCNDNGHFFGVGRDHCTCGLRDRMVVVGRGLQKMWQWKIPPFTHGSLTGHNVQ